MCGIAGFWGAPGEAAAMQRLARRMGNAIRHRGPDDHGEWVDEAAGVGLSHRRLSIIDLSPAGHQPMVSHSGRYQMVFNGEIYSFAALRDGLPQAVSWRGHSDTEIMLACFDAYGVEASVPKFDGMFAFAVWDTHERVLHFARDRFGEKPLYYGLANGTLLFGSELKALWAHEAWEGEIDAAAVALFFRYAYVPAPLSVFRGIKKLAAGTMLTVREADVRARELPTPTPYWTIEATAERCRKNPLKLDDETAVASLERVMLASVKAMMVADVPLGAMLSGGIDSSTVVALMTKAATKKVRTFSIGFESKAYDESAHAAAVARHLGTDHTQLTVTDREARETVPLMATMYDEPFADSSQLPTYLVCKLARAHVTVAVSGDAGDELFGGYNRHFTGASLWGGVRQVPAGVRGALGKGLHALSPSFVNAAVETLIPVERLRPRMPAEKVGKVANVLSATSVAEFYDGLTSIWAADDAPTTTRPSRHPALLPLDEAVVGVAMWMMLQDAATYLPDDVLAKVDRAGMATSLELRIPFLAPSVAEFAWSLPLEQKVRGGKGKWAVRELLYRHVPRELVDRPKMGFSLPIDEWLRGPMRGWAEGHLSRDALARSGLLRHEPIEAKWQAHVSGRANTQHALWTVLMFQEWFAGYRAAVARLQRDD